MSKDKEYCFEFAGTREMFLEKLQPYPSNTREFAFYDYLIDISESNYRFGVARGGHSGGYWFEPTVTELDGKLILSGRIRYIDSYSEGKAPPDEDNKTAKFITLVLGFPILVPVIAYALIEQLYKKLRRQPIGTRETEEDKLYNLMENLLGCTRRQPSSVS